MNDFVNRLVSTWALKEINLIDKGIRTENWFLSDEYTELVQSQQQTEVTKTVKSYNLTFDDRNYVFSHIKTKQTNLYGGRIESIYCWDSYSVKGLFSYTKTGLPEDIRDYYVVINVTDEKWMEPFDELLEKVEKIAIKYEELV